VLVLHVRVLYTAVNKKFVHTLVSLKSLGGSPLPFLDSWRLDWGVDWGDPEKIFPFREV